jgi:HEPN domain-containing protein
MSLEGPPEPPPADAADAPATWVRYARADLAVARLPLPDDGLWETHCFHAQQAAEKSVKAVLLDRGIEFPFTHNLERLLELLPADIAQPPDLSAAAYLTPYATSLRYPGGEPQVTEDEYREAVRLAELVVAWAERIIAGGTTPERPDSESSESVEEDAG